MTLSTLVNGDITPVGFQDVNQAQPKLFFNKIPTNFSLTDEQVDKLIKTAGWSAVMLAMVVGIASLLIAFYLLR